MEEIKKIKLKDEQQVENNGGAVKNPKRLPPTGNGNGTGKEFSQSANTQATAELTSGNYHWTIGAGANATVSVKYVKNPDTGEWEFDSGTISIGTLSFSAGAGDPVFDGIIEEGGVKTGTEYTPVGTSGSLGTQIMIPIYNLYYPETINIPITLIGFAATYDHSTTPEIPSRRDSVNVGLCLSVGFSCDPYTGISGLSMGLSV
jgi:hypothetical protein